jgi:hypothetical protein
MATASVGALEDSPIHTTVSSNGLSLYIDMIYGIAIPASTLFSSTAVEGAFDVAEQLLSPDITNELLEALKAQAKDKPWASFVLAAQLRDRELADHALWRMPDEWGLDTIRGSDIKDLPPDWLAGLLFCRLSPRQPDYDDIGEHNHRIRSWADAADAFVPRP